MSRSILRGLALVSALLVGIGSATELHAETLTPVKFRLDWVWQSPQSIWTLAYERGYFKEEGLDVTIDRGYGSPDNMAVVAAGTYDITFSDINYMAEFNTRNPASKLISVFVVYDGLLATVITRKGNGINTPKDLEGKVIGAPLGTGGRTLFPAFAKVNGIDEKKVSWQTISPQLQDQQFAQGQFDAIAGFATTSLLNLKQLGVDRNTLTTFNFFNYGLDLYGSALIVRRDYAEANPETLRKFLRVTMRGMKDMLADKKAAVLSLKKRDPMLNVDIEIDRLDLMIEMGLKTPSVDQYGVSYVDPVRMNRAMAIVADAFNLSPVPTVDDMFTDKYLPPAADRRLKFD
ncbi:MAG TPA: ABC transporter substrate-binding protein [Alphaproteobacteria bacterium]